VQKIWMSDIKNISSVDFQNEFKIYFSDVPEITKFYNGGKPIEKTDIWWNGKYPNGYFDN
uniref:hypothetical protein n=2 Tax=unclassified Spiroplasma TaxID=2637901 RepID=UPI002079BDC2